MPYPDVVQLVSELLLSSTVADNAALYALSVKRVFCESKPLDHAPTAATLIIQSEDGHFRVSSSSGLMRVGVLCYGGTDSPVATKTLVRVLVERMHKVRTTAVASGIIISAVHNGGGERVLWTPRGVEPFAIVYFDVNCRAT